MEQQQKDSISTAITPTPTSEVADQHNKIGSTTLGAALIDSKKKSYMN